MRSGVLAVAALATGCFNPHLTQGLPCADDGWCPPPQSCMAGICSGGGGEQPDAPGPAPNVMFTTSALFTPIQHSQPVLDADLLCNTLGAKLSPGHFVAWLSDDTQDAAQRLLGYNATGWVRPDGKPFADTVDDIVNGRIFYPPALDENNANVADPVNYIYVVTKVPANCSTSVVDVGAPDGEPPEMLRLGVSNCSTSLRLYCFEVERQARVAPRLDRTKRFAFLTAQPVAIKAPNVTMGIDDLDAECASEGTVLDASRNFLAFVAPTGATAQSRFVFPGAGWVRPDGVQVTSDLKTFDAPISVLPTGEHLPAYAWFGAQTLTTLGADSTNCTEWRSTSGSASLGNTIRSVAEGFSNASNTTCATAGHVYCFEH